MKPGLKWSLALLVCLALLAVALLRGPHTAAPLSMEGRLERHAGGHAELSELRGKVVVLNFWATWCAPCIAEIPQLVEVAQAMAPRGAVLLAVNQDEGERTQVKDVVDEFFYTHPTGLKPYVVYAEEGFSGRFGIRSLPTTFVLDATGKVRARFVGGVRAPALREAVERALVPG